MTLDTKQIQEVVEAVGKTPKAIRDRRMSQLSMQAYKVKGNFESVANDEIKSNKSVRSAKKFEVDSVKANEEERNLTKNTPNRAI